MTPAEKLKEIEENQMGRACATDGRLPKEYYETEWLINRVHQLTEVAQDADSYLSLIYHRHSSNLPSDLREEIGLAYTKARRVLEGE